LANVRRLLPPLFFASSTPAIARHRLSGPCLPLPIRIRKLTHFFASSLICTLLLPSSLYLHAYAMPYTSNRRRPEPPLSCNGENQCSSKCNCQVKGFSAQNYPIAPPMPPTDARFYFETGKTSLARRDEIAATAPRQRGHQKIAQP